MRAIWKQQIAFKISNLKRSLLKQILGYSFRCSEYEDLKAGMISRFENRKQHSLIEYILTEFYYFFILLFTILL